MNTLHLYLQNLDHNYRQIRKKIQPNTLCIGVVKANAYGTEFIHFAKRLVELGVDTLAVAYTEEGVQLRKEGIKIPIMVFYPQKNSLEALIESNLEPCLYSKHLLLSFEILLNEKKIENYPIHIKYNTGLNRVGFPFDEVNWILDKISLPCFNLKTVYSHLAASEEKRPSLLCDKQIQRFKKIKEQHSKKNEAPPKFHLLNSSGIFNYPEFQFDAVRCGIAFHGFANHPDWDKLLKPVAQLETIITQIHDVMKGESVGYDHGWKAPEQVRIASLPLGHADGIGRHFGNQSSSVIIHGQEAPIVGNVCMDMLMVDVSEISCEEGDKVNLFGPLRSASEFAVNGGSISYEVLAGLGSRIKRVIHF
ncbi:alanine racemase [Flavobacteriaceae bacterium]|nr:alanine racemase [Flavobacteriaceae bacterium]